MSNIVKIRSGFGPTSVANFAGSNIAFDEDGERLYGLHSDGETVFELTGLKGSEVDQKILDLNLGTAATRNTGTSQNQIPILGVGGKLDEGVLPALALTEVFVVADIVARDTLSVAEPSEVQEGDVAVVTDASEDDDVQEGSASYIYDGTNWIRLKSPAKSHSELLAIMGSSEGFHLSEDQHETLTDGENADSLHGHSFSGLDGVNLSSPSIGQFLRLAAEGWTNINLNSSHVGLGNVDNYATATPAQTAAGTASNLFVTPAGVAQAIQDLVPEAGATNLSIGNRTSAIMEVVSSTGDNVDLLAATENLAGLLTASGLQEIGGVKQFLDPVDLLGGLTFDEVGDSRIGKPGGFMQMADHNRIQFLLDEVGGGEIYDFTATGADFHDKHLQNAIIDCGTY